MRKLEAMQEIAFLRHATNLLNELGQERRSCNDLRAFVAHIRLLHITFRVESLGEVITSARVAADHRFGLIQMSVRRTSNRA